MIEQENRPTNFWERTLTAIAITFSIVGYYKTLSSAQAAPYEIYDREIFKKDSEKILQLQKVKWRIDI
ncbi:MAG: hypothetical protein ACFCU5_07480 [Pleurocapsa sp.]